MERADDQRNGYALCRTISIGAEEGVGTPHVGRVWLLHVGAHARAQPLRRALVLLVHRPRYHDRQFSAHHPSSCADRGLWPAHHAHANPLTTPLHYHPSPSLHDLPP